MTTKSSENDAITLSRVNFSAYVGHVTVFSWMFMTACCSAAGLDFHLGLDFVFGWSEAMHTYLY